VPHSVIDWEDIASQYIEGTTGPEGTLVWLSMEEIAERNSVAASNLRRRASREGWTDQRALYRQRSVAERQNERIAEMARLGADLDLSALRVARSGLIITARRLGELGQMAQARAEEIEARRADGMSTSTAGLPPAPSSEEVNTLGRAATTWYELGTKAIGDVPRSEVVVDVEVSGELDVATRDARTQGILAVLLEADALPGELRGLVGDAAAARPTGSDESAPGDGDDAARELLHSVDPDD